VARLVRAYGSSAERLVEAMSADPVLGDRYEPASAVTRAEVEYAVREEMALKLADVVFRRTDLGTGAHPGEEALRVCSTLMASELRWDSGRTEDELHEVNAMFPQLQTV
jgi:glycerol-3-phosphate dehydrogenase